MNASHQLAKHQPKSSARRKVKSGCKTCKIRRVKCDEGKPVCSRCYTTGRVCDGYGIWGGGGNGYAERYGLAKRQASPPVVIERGPTKTIGTEELRYLQLFRLRYIHTVSGWFGSRFWSTTVLPATSSEPAILHAIIALSAAHRCNFHSSQAPDARERFMLQQYSKAIHLLQSVLHQYDKSAVTIALIVCQIFTFLEYLRGMYTAAEAHLRNGLKLLRDMDIDDSSSPAGVIVLKPTSHAKVVDKSIVQRFATLHVQAGLFGQQLSNIDLLLQPLEAEVPFPVFANAEEAKDSVDKLLHSVVLLSRRFQENESGDKEYSSTLLQDLHHTETLLTAWFETYLRTASNFGIRLFGIRKSAKHKMVEGPLAFGSQTLPNGVNAREPLAYRLILNFHTMATIMCKCISPGSEAKYEAHTEDFLSILEGAIEIWKTYALARQIPGNVELAHSIGECGPIPPLYYTAIKCRNHRIRLHAIKLLGGVQYKEGVWESLLAANIARKVMELEEHGIYQGWSTDDGFSMYDLPVAEDAYFPPLPESSLFHHVQVDLQDDPAKRALLTCKRWHADGSLETVQYQFFGEYGLESERLR
ncbi:hypothetical protein BKA66DRAFT_551841 [Pyrenochaeta sp. MPI-SDFR-AT-0127]|nr:hypothetical protein BKA66DRAFT_551841 [Pyrenochaeta sp. MPI-SDFR-AT-0127]